MAKSLLWIGLDVGADEMSVCGTDNEGAVLFQHCCPTKAAALHDVLRRDKRRIALIGLESGSFGIALTHGLKKLGYPVAIFEARQASKFLAIRRNKTDKNDARGLADLARLGRGLVSEVCLKSPDCQRLRSTLIMRQKLVQIRVAIEAAIRSLVRLNGGSLKSSSSSAAFRRNVQLELTRLRRAEKIDLRRETAPLVELSCAAREYVESLDVQLLEEAQGIDVCRRLMKIAGVGPLTALAFYSSIGTPHRFSRGEDVGAYLGLVPRVHESGQNTAKRRISKAGDKLTRTLLVTAAQQHVRWADTAISRWATELSGRLKPRGVHTAVARKLAVVMLSMWKSGQPYTAYPDIVSEPSAT
jgi:transposase